MHNNLSLRALCESAVFLAIAVGLSFTRIFELPYGGSVTLCSMLPIFIIAIRWGLSWGLLAGFCYSWLQILQGGVFGWGLTPTILVASLILDYIFAFTILGTAGIFRKKGKVGMFFGMLFATILRFLSHFVSGFVLWTNYGKFIDWFGNEIMDHPIFYSLIYNGSFMLPEALITIGVASILLFTPISKYLFVPMNIKNPIKAK